MYLMVEFITNLLLVAEKNAVRVTGKVYRITQSLQSLGIPKRIEWEILEVTTILNITRIYSN